MKKVLGALALSMSMAASAENWVAVMDATDGTRMLVDSDSWIVGKDDKNPNSPYYAMAMFKFAGEGKIGDSFVYVTEVKSCDKGRGELVYRARNGDKWETKATYWFEADGHKMYDAGGKALCDIFWVRAREMKEDKAKKNPAKLGSMPNV
jgi:hypothetical protein